MSWLLRAPTKHLTFLTSTQTHQPSFSPWLCFADTKWCCGAPLSPSPYLTRSRCKCDLFHWRPYSQVQVRSRCRASTALCHILASPRCFTKRAPRWRNGWVSKNVFEALPKKWAWLDFPFTCFMKTYSWYKTSHCVTVQLYGFVPACFVLRAFMAILCELNYTTASEEEEENNLSTFVARLLLFPYVHVCWTWSDEPS